MIDVYIKVLSRGLLRREHISAWIHGMLSKKYHDEGLSKYFNKSSVKAHTFDFEYGRLLEVGDVTRITIRGINPIESKILSFSEATGKVDIGNSSLFAKGDKVYLGKVEGEIFVASKEEYVVRSEYSLLTPLILRVSDRDDRLENDDYYRSITPGMDKELWEELLINSIKRKAGLIYGEGVLDGDIRGIEVIRSKEVRAELNIKGKKMVYRAFMGDIRIDADLGWINFMQRTGLGNRNTYGYGVIN